MYFSFKAYRLDLNQTSMQNRVPQHASTLPPCMRTLQLLRNGPQNIITSENRWECGAWHRGVMYLNVPQKLDFGIFCARPRKGAHFWPIFWKSEAHHRHLRNCINPIHTYYVSCDHPSIMQAKVWCFEQRMSDEPMKWMPKIPVFLQYSYLTNQINTQFIGEITI